MLPSPTGELGIWYSIRQDAIDLSPSCVKCSTHLRVANVVVETANPFNVSILLLIKAEICINKKDPLCDNQAGWSRSLTDERHCCT